MVRPCGPAVLTARRKIGYRTFGIIPSHLPQLCPCLMIDLVPLYGTRHHRALGPLDAFQNEVKILLRYRLSVQRHKKTSRNRNWPGPTKWPSYHTL